ncbi:MAG: hypothetical protein CL607_10050 [Anaerolineaceae bacterium]|nr:hypothetical protein [Anaerolineaceae bacterium]
MKTNNTSALNKRVLKINVGFLLSDGPGHSHDSRLDIAEPIKVADDLLINKIDGKLRLSRMKEGILVQADLTVVVDTQCNRCLDTFEQELNIQLEELYAYPRPIGQSEFYVGADTMLDLAPLLRAEVLIQMSHKTLCRPDCKGLCPTCGVNLNNEQCDCDHEYIDPRLADLKKLLDSSD